MNVVDVFSEDVDPPEWIPNVKQFIQKVLSELNIDSVELSVLLCNEKKITELNKRYRGKSYSTDVLSFSQLTEFSELTNTTKGQRIVLGDIVVSLEDVKKNAASFGVEFEEELKRVIIHGVLHLIGMEHEDNSVENKMIELQEKILKRFTEERLF